MKRLYSHDNHFIVFNIKNILENNGISCQIRNDVISTAAGEVPPIDVWPEVWVEHEKDYFRAEKLIDEAVNGKPGLTSWFCSKCSENNAPAFELCWKCGNDREV